jgi:hypothetical protein
VKSVTIRPGPQGQAQRPVEHRERVFLLALVYGVGLLAYVLIEPTQVWILAILALLVALGTDGILRAYSRGRLRRLDDTAVQLTLPVLFAVGAAVFVELMVEGYWAVPVTLAMAASLGTIVHAQCHSLDHRSSEYLRARIILHSACYVTAFFFLVAILSEQVALGWWSRAAAAGLVSSLLALEALRDAASQPMRAVALALAMGTVMGQATWALTFLPLNASAGVVLLLLCFYVLTGMVQHILAGQLGPVAVLEFAGVASLGMGGVIAVQRLF